MVGIFLGDLPKKKTPPYSVKFLLLNDDLNPPFPCAIIV